MNIFFGKKKVNKQLINPKETILQPSISFNTVSNKLYTLIMYDPTIYGDFIHWVIINMVGPNITDKVIKNNILLPYKCPTPPIHTGLHHYIFTIYEQTNFIKHINIERNTPLNKLLNNLNLIKEPVFSNYFVSKFANGGASKGASKGATRSTTRSKNTKTKTRTVKRKQRKNIKKLTRKIKGGTILGKGKDGCIIDSISYNDSNDYVAKLIYEGTPIHKELNDKLAEIDPENKHFNRYFILNVNLDENPDFIKCSQEKPVNNKYVLFQKLLIPLNETKMTKEQYRYLRNSLDILHKNNISHGDLPGNVMLDPKDNMPRIIDWEESKLNADDLDKRIDRNAFSQFKVSKV